MSTTTRRATSACLNTAALLMATSYLTPVGALAACLPSPAVSGSTITCSGTDTLGVGTGIEDNVSLIVMSGASIVVSGDGYAVSLATNAQVVNSGSISDTGVLVGSGSKFHNTASGSVAGTVEGLVGAGSTILNEGNITSDGTGVRIIDADLTNSGTISAIGGAPNGLDTIGSTILNHGKIYAEGTGFSNVVAIYAGNFNAVTNEGLVHAKATGNDGVAIGIWGYGLHNEIINNDTIKVDANGAGTGMSFIDAKVVNTGDLLVNGGSATGIRSNYSLDLNNSGSISVKSDNTDAAAVIAGGGSNIINSGTITASGGDKDVGIVGGNNVSGPLQVLNSGTIEADVAITVTGGDTSARPVNAINSGVIQGDLLLGSAGDNLFNMSTGKINGDISMADGSDVVINTGTITGNVSLGAGDDFFFNDTGDISAADGVIDPGEGWDGFGIYANVSQSGTLKLSDGFEAAAVYVEEAAVFTISEGSGDPNGMAVSLVGTGVVINEASLSAQSGLATLTLPENRPQHWNDGLEFRNAASITAANYGIEGGDNNVIINTEEGLISSDNYAIHAGEHNDITNLGVIKSETGGIFIASGNSDDLNGDGYKGVTNLGTIEAPVGIALGPAFVVGGAISNNVVVNGSGGQITAHTGIVVGSNINRIYNLGSIDAEAFGIRVAGTDSNLIINTDSNLIINGVGGTISAGDDGIHLLGDGNAIDNSGRIQGGQLGQDDFGKANGSEAHGMRLVTDGSWVNNDGEVYSGKGHAISVDGLSNDIVNGPSGIIDSTGANTQIVGLDAIRVYGVQSTVTNQGGTISGARYGVSLIGSKNSLDNQGLITGDTAVHLEDGPHTIVNSGTLVGSFAAIDNGNGTLTLKNSGLIDGDVLLGSSGDDVELAKGSIIKGDVVGGSGFDAIKATGDGLLAGKLTGIDAFTVEEGTLDLSLDEGSSATTTTVNGGTLRLEGTLATAATVAADGALSGTGTIQGSLSNQGTVMPGNSVGTFTVTGSYSQGATGQLLVELGAAGSDKFAVTGTATLDGVLATALLGTDLGALEGKSYTVLTAGGISGGFDTAGVVQQGFWTLNVQQSATAVTVTVVDVNLTIGASVPFTGALAGAISSATPQPQTQGGNGPPPGDDQQSTSLDYDSMGDWESTVASFTGDRDALGERTPAGAMPRTGTAAFEGTTRGEMTETDAPQAFVVEGNVLLTADFASGLVNADFTGMEKIDAAGVASAWVDFRARMSIADGTSEFSGTAGTDDGVWSGEARGGFFGDDDGMPGRAAGLWSLSSPLGRALGGFTARRQ
jgi:fibronectin-binding autotransporter adhesin